MRAAQQNAIKNNLCDNVMSTHPSAQNCVEAAMDVTSTPIAEPAHAAIFGKATASKNPSRVPSAHPGPGEVCARAHENNTKVAIKATRDIAPDAMSCVPPRRGPDTLRPR